MKTTRRAYFATAAVAAKFATKFDHKRYYVRAAPYAPKPGRPRGVVVVVVDVVEQKRRQEMNKWLRSRKCAACRFGRCFAHHPRCARREDSPWGF